MILLNPPTPLFFFPGLRDMYYPHLLCFKLHS
jgi:hypothetical protein